MERGSSGQRTVGMDSHGNVGGQQVAGRGSCRGAACRTGTTVQYVFELSDAAVAKLEALLGNEANS